MLLWLFASPNIRGRERYTFPFSNQRELDCYRISQRVGGACKERNGHLTHWLRKKKKEPILNGHKD